MTNQEFFNYYLSEIKDEDNFFTNSTNKDVLDIINNNLINQNIFLYGPPKSGKSHVVNIWKDKNNAIIFDNNFDDLLNIKKNIIIDNLNKNKSEEQIFHLINHCKSSNLKIFITSSTELRNFSFHLEDLFSRLCTFYYIKINQPDDEMCKILMTKLFFEKQIIIRNKDIFDFIINRVSRTYKDIYLLVQKIDKLSLQKKRQLTIPLIKEIL